MFGCIYKIECKINGFVYIGQTTQKLNERVKRHLYEAQHGKTSNNIYKDLLRYTIDSFYSSIIETCETKESMDEKEKYWIKYYRDSLGIEKVYNKTDGGRKANPYDNKSKEEMRIVKEKMRIAKIGYVPCNKGVPMSQEQKEKVSKAKKGSIPHNKGIPHKQATKDKISKIRKEKGLAKGSNNSNAKKVICLETKEVFNTMREGAIKVYGNKKFYVRIWKSIKKERTIEGFSWKYYEEKDISCN